MGLNTFNSIGAKPLPNRKNIILNNDLAYVPPEGCFVAHSIDEVLEMINPVRKADQLDEYVIISTRLQEGNLDELSAEIFRKKFSADGFSNGVKNDPSTGSGQEQEVMICGGASVYKQFLPLAQRLYLTYIHQNFEGDTYFPEVNMAEWKEVKRTDFKADNPSAGSGQVKNKYDYSFVVLERK